MKDWYKYMIMVVIHHHGNSRPLLKEYKSLDRVPRVEHKCVFHFPLTENSQLYLTQAQATRLNGNITLIVVELKANRRRTTLSEE